MQIRCVIFLGNPVGYANSNIAEEEGTYIVKSAAFSSIGVKNDEGQDCIRLSDISITGYQSIEETEGLCFGGVYIQMLNTDGSNQINADGDPIMYKWIDDGDRDIGWYDINEEPIENANEILFQCGQGLVFNLDPEYVGCKIVSAGQVLEGQVMYTALEEGTNHFVGNPLARKVYLSELFVTGYEDNPDTEGLCFGGIYIQILNTDGSNTLNSSGDPIMYKWIDDGDRTTGWYDINEEPIEDADTIGFEVSEGLTLNFDSDYVGCSLVFPSLGLKAE